jgi:hypothetical protein
MPIVLRWVAAGLAIVALVYFWVLSLSMINLTWAATSKVVLPDSQIYWVGVLAGLIGGFVATAFNVKVPPPEVTPSGAKEQQPRWLKAIGAVIRLLGRLLGDVNAKLNDIVGVLYLLSYVVIGLAAIYTVNQHGDVAPDALKSIAAVSAGLFIAIVRNFMGPKS